VDISQPDALSLVRAEDVATGAVVTSNNNNPRSCVIMTVHIYDAGTIAFTGFDCLP